MKPSEQTLHDFLHTMPAVLYEYAQHRDGSGELLYMSPTSRDILGHPCEYFIGDTTPFMEIVHPDDRERLRKIDEETIDDSSFATECRIVLPSGEIKWIRFNSKPSSETKEGTVIWSGCIIDITQLKQAKEEIKALRGILPLCSFCKKIRDDKGYWEQVDVYIHKHSKADISHSICPECLKKHYPDV